MDVLCPGVYMQEISTGARPIEAVGTSTAAFVGEAPNKEARANEAFAVNNWTSFVREYVHKGSTTTNTLAQAVFGFFENGGRRCFVVNVANDQPLAGGGNGHAGLDALKTKDEVAIVAAPGRWDVASHNDLLTHCELMQDRVAILDAPEHVTDLGALTKSASAPVPGQPPPPPESAGFGPRRSPNGYGAFYFPWITVRDLFDPKKMINVPPSGHIAGIYARSDATRGVHKAPANEVVRGALNLAHELTREDQGQLNQAGVNCLRFFARQGILLWGARTVADPGSEWRYINVRRLFNQVEESIARATNWVVFEPNDQTLWKSIRRDIGAFLTLFWRDGALAGRTPAEAFFVKCDEETNPQESIDAGRVVTVIGMAPVKPAEFVIFQIGQHHGGTVVQEMTNA